VARLEERGEPRIEEAALRRFVLENVRNMEEHFEQLRAGTVHEGD
jgi:hypothetical protein